MKNKTKIIIVSTVLLSSLLVGSTAFAQTIQSTTTGTRHSRMHRAPGVFGTVSMVSGTTLTVTSKGFGQSTTATTYTVDATNATVTKDGSASTLVSVSVGDSVMVEGTVSGTSVIATAINDGKGGMGMGHGMNMMREKARGIFGTVSSVSGNTITVTSKVGQGGEVAVIYTVDATNATVEKDGATSTLSAVAVGSNVSVEGTVTGTSVVATAIRDGRGGPGIGHGEMGGRGMGSSSAMMSLPAGNGQPVVAGSVTTITGTVFTITNKAGASFTIDGTNATVTKQGATSSVGAIVVGDIVVVQGTVTGSSVTAVTIMDQGGQTSQAPITNAQGVVTPQHKGFLGMLGGFFGHFFGF